MWRIGDFAIDINLPQTGSECGFEYQRRSPNPIPSMPARRRNAPTVRFISFEIFATGVCAFECAFNVRISSFVHDLITRRVAFGGAILFAATAVVFFTGFLDISSLQIE